MVRPLIGALLLVLSTTACATSSKGTPLAVPSATSSPTKSVAAETKTTTTSAAPSGDEKKIGKAQTVKDGKDSAVITLVSVRTATKGKDGMKPKSGTYVIFMLKIECKTGSISTNSLYAQLKTPDGKMVDGTAGNAFLATFEPDLPLKDIGPGESAEGNVVLDTPMPAGSKIVWLDPLDKPLAEWAI
jgi:hypothetical protein